MRLLALILNLLWFVLGGWAVAIHWFLGGLLMAITIIGLPYVPGIWRIAVFSAFPFGQEMVSYSKGGGHAALTGLLNVFWLVFAGIWIAIAHLLTGILFCITLIGIPFGIAHFKLAGAALMPVGKEIIPRNARTVARLVQPVR